MKSKGIKQAMIWAKGEAKGRYQERIRQLEDDLMYDRISRNDYGRILKQYRDVYRAELKDIENMYG